MHTPKPSSPPSPRWRLGLAVSGGADSVALLVLLAHLQTELSFTAVVLHVDHGLRTESAAEADYVSSLARTFNLPLRIFRTHVVRMRGESLEMAARRVRLTFFEQMIQEEHLDAIATGHHADDVAETFLMRLARGSGAEGLAGLKPISHVGPITFIRPLLNLRDRDLRAFLRAEGISWCEDASNQDCSILRNRVRHVVIPFLEAHLDAHLTEHICKTCAILRGELTRAQPAVVTHPSEKTPSYTLTITPSYGFEMCHTSIGTVPVSCDLSRAALAHRTLEVRTWLPGDRIFPTSFQGRSRKLQDVFVTAKVPPDVRKVWPLLVDQTTQEILWVPGYRIAQSVAVESPHAPSWHLTLSS